MKNAYQNQNDISLKLNNEYKTETENCIETAICALPVNILYDSDATTEFKDSDFS